MSWNNPIDPIDNAVHKLVGKAVSGLKPNTGSSGPTLQQQQLETLQATETANLNVQENEQRKSILSAMQGTRVFRGSALSRAVAGNTSGNTAPAPGPSGTQTRGDRGVFSVGSTNQSLLDQVTVAASPSGATPAGGAGAGAGRGGYAGGGGTGGGARTLTR